MIIEPDAEQAEREQRTVVDALRAILLGDPEGGDPLDGVLVDLRYPGVFAVGFGLRTGVLSRTVFDRSSLDVLAGRAGASVERAAGSPCPAWRLDLAPPEPHLSDALTRAAGQVPSTPDRGRPDVHVAAWRPQDRSRWCASVCLLDQVWPELLAELRVTVRQLALIGGRGVGGFAADFGAHGAVFINRRRLDDGEGLPARIRFAEHLAHESTHVRLHAAAGADRFLVDPGDRKVLVRTPLRDDPRPLNGLFQQFVVLSRCVSLLDRMLHSPAVRDSERTPALARRGLLAGHASRAAAVLSENRAALTERGRGVLDDAAAAAAR